MKLLLLLPAVGLLVPAIYNRRTPELFSIPFFYWYQLLWVLLTVGLLVIVYRATRSDEE
jgi:hypothetical protein